jgi:hypothetical protein
MLSQNVPDHALPQRPLNCFSKDGSMWPSIGGALIDSSTEAAQLLPQNSSSVPANVTIRRENSKQITRRQGLALAPIFREHVATMEKVFAVLSPDELRQFEPRLKRIGRQAESLFEQRTAERRSEKTHA